MAKFRIRMSRKASVFVLEDSDERMDWFRHQFPNLKWASTAAGAIGILKDHEFDVVFLDHDLGLLDYQGYSAGGEGTGRDVARFLSGRAKLGSIVIIHSWNNVGAAAMKDLLAGAVAIPFGQFSIDWED